MTGRRSRRDDDIARTIKGLNGHRSAERSVRHRDLQFALKVIPHALENGILVDVHLNKEVTRRSALNAGVALPRQTDTHALLHTLGNLDFDGLRGAYTALTGTLLAWRHNDGAVAMARGTR